MSEQTSHHKTGEYPSEQRLATNPTAGNWERETLEKLVFQKLEDFTLVRWGMMR